MNDRPGTHLGVTHDVGGVVLDGPGDPKVDELQLSLDEHEVGWFEVRVDDALPMDGVHGLQHVLQDEDNSNTTQGKKLDI